MTQRDIERAVSRATGESIGTVRRLGFSVIEPAELDPLVVDWDEYDADRVGIFPARKKRRLSVAA